MAAAAPVRLQSADLAWPVATLAGTLFFSEAGLPGRRLSSGPGQTWYNSEGLLPAALAAKTEKG